MNHNRLLAVLFATLLIVGGGCAELGIFTFDDGILDSSPTSSDWQAGDDWNTRLTTTIADSRDTGLEDHVNADYQRRTFTGNIWQGAVRASTINTAKYTRGARVSVELNVTINAAGTAGIEVFFQDTTLPPGLSTTTPTSTSLGTFIYFRAGISIISGTCLWDGTELVLYVGGVQTAALGSSPSFAVANGDILVANWSYIPKPVP